MKEAVKDIKGKYQRKRLENFHNPVGDFRRKAEYKNEYKTVINKDMDIKKVEELEKRVSVIEVG